MARLCHGRHRLPAVLLRVERLGGGHGTGPGVASRDVELALVEAERARAATTMGVQVESLERRAHDRHAQIVELDCEDLVEARVADVHFGIVCVIRHAARAIGASPARKVSPLLHVIRRVHEIRRVRENEPQALLLGDEQPVVDCNTLLGAKRANHISVVELVGPAATLSVAVSERESAQSVAASRRRFGPRLADAGKRVKPPEVMTEAERELEELRRQRESSFLR